jgi:hypothetical protein
MQQWPKAFAVVAVGVCVFWMATVAKADIIYSTGHQQFTNIHFAGEANGLTVTGQVGNTGADISFQGFGPGLQPIPLHADNGVAFIRPFNSTDTIFEITFSAGAGFAFSAFNLSLDAVNRTGTGTVAFQAFFANGKPIPASPSSGNTFPISDNGNNKYGGLVENGEPPIEQLQVTSTLPLAHLRQVSVNVVPATTSQVPEVDPQAWAAASTFLLGGLLVVRGRHGGRRRMLA